MKWDRSKSTSCLIAFRSSAGETRTREETEQEMSRATRGVPTDCEAGRNQPMHPVSPPSLPPGTCTPYFHSNHVHMLLVSKYIIIIDINESPWPHSTFTILQKPSVAGTICDKWSPRPSSKRSGPCARGRPGPGMTGTRATRRNARRHGGRT